MEALKTIGANREWKTLEIMIWIAIVSMYSGVTLSVLSMIIR